MSEEYSMPRPYGALLRVSGRRQVKEETIEIQEQHIRLWCERRGIDPAEQVYFFYDRAVSGDVPLREREGGGRLLDLAERGLITEGVIVYKINRAAREDLLGYLELEYVCAENDLVLYSTQDVIDTSTKAGRTMGRLRAVLADDEKRELVDRLADAKRARARMGRWQTRAPYGWKIGDDKRLVLHPVTSLVVREMVRLLLDERLSVYKIADALSAQGIPAPQGGARWDYTVILKMLRNPLLYGQARYNQTQVIRRKGRKVRQIPRPEDDHIVIEVEPLIDRATFARVQDAISANARSHDGSVTEHFWLAGLVKCGECGRTYNPQANRGKGGTWYYYRHAHKGQSTCPYNGSQVPRDVVDTQVWEEIVWAATNTPAWRARTQAAQPPIDARAVEQAAQAVSAAEARLAELEESYFMRGTTSAERYDAIAPRLTATLNLARRALADAKDTQARRADAHNAVERTAGELARLRAVIERVERVDHKRDIAAVLVRRVVVLEHGREPGSRYGTPRARLRVEWKG
jgi:site-specific DNA recombinase